MNEITRTLDRIEEGDPQAPAQLLPLVYAELRKLAAGHFANEAAGHTLNATALVHEAYLRLVGPMGERTFANRAHFFGAAAEAMRRILVDHARRKRAQKRPSQGRQASLDPAQLPGSALDLDRWLDLDTALTRLEAIDHDAANLAKLRIFSGLSVAEAAETLHLSRATGFRCWTYARAWLNDALGDQPEES